MGFRTVVVFNNDLTHTWEKDPELGRKIMMDMHRHPNVGISALEAIGGRVIECTHADTQTLVVMDGYSGDPVAYGHWHRGQTEEQKQLALLKDLADKLGYRVSKLPARKV